ncbi:hypothetical protein PHIM7_27 [Sinorhizobium phage phiM7]|uniref:Uncharacterized protein n=3 Tax=Emdodecavirus TaxID=1980937 RepID=S5MUZ7_9CAUD|nr:hypothetical protein AB690_gp032 [Sinorhizobium phage phiM12]YP_009212282.1 hypothetical protein AVT40_gp042 [Sinorhizobium phage phiN3]YP_009601152.1 hypothetical protein FDH46_gp027 [Sinorhizobium phage phiM7]AKF12935.1 hypothetical protein PHIM19_28 [Sinorhizobium phage phiM19]AGR47672.1 hypothetical protein SmphiM12_040 [Sinorhizobium phage phiM12]AKF12575.1 hypothetical protein PHIM7_27 [Sinorhizobium phage phiM7]AKF13307.1 hypothetical protein PHIN3_42 [Sinorhizobium phage phiN3]
MSETQITHSLVTIELLKGAQLVIRAAAERSAFKLEEYAVVSSIYDALTRAIETPDSTEPEVTETPVEA